MSYLLPHLIDAAAGRAPARDAFRCDGVGLSYAALVARSNRLAHVLHDQGVRRGDRVGLYLNKSLASAVALYGIMKAGAAYVPLDPTMPAGRLRFVLRDCGIRHLVTHPPRRHALPAVFEEATPLECVIGLPSGFDGPARTLTWDDVDAAPATPPAGARMERDLAYIMYTSGSTGTPKGIMHTHASGLSYARQAARTYGVGPDDRLSNHSPLHFDMSTFDYFSGPLAGATTVIIPEAYTKLPASLSQLIERERLTIWYSVPFALIQLLLRGVLEDRDLTALRWVLFGGEPFPIKHLRALMQQWPHARFSNVYGPAEVNQCTYYHVPAPPAEDETTIPIGPVWDNAEALVLDDDDQPVADGEAGELVVRTPTMMHGYWGRPDLNARAFYRQEHAPGYEAVYYRTGDLVQQGTDGAYRFLGRKDRQVKTRGYRVELDEVEEALMADEHVEAAAVYAVPDGEGSRRIEAAVILRPGTTATPKALTQHVATRVPWYAVPAHIVLTDAFPRTTSGKIDRRALQAQAQHPDPA